MKYLYYKEIVALLGYCFWCSLNLASYTAVYKIEIFIRILDIRFLDTLNQSLAFKSIVHPMTFFVSLI